jgi:hypothetical protein
MLLPYPILNREHELANVSNHVKHERFRPINVPGQKRSDRVMQRSRNSERSGTLGA